MVYPEKLPGANYAKPTKSMTAEKWDNRSPNVIIMLSNANIPPPRGQ
jgi:hypothetical protein